MTESLNTYDVTVALLTRDAGPLLGRVLDAICAQDTGRSVELLAIDSGSTDGTLECLRGHGARLFEIAPDEFDFGLTRDRAFEEARGDVVVSLSQDAVPAHGKWLDNLVGPLDGAAYVASCGRSIPDPARAEPQFPWEKNGYFYFTREMRKFAARYGKGLSNANSAIRRDAWERLRFGRQAIGEDFQFQAKLHEEGLRIAFPDEAQVYHHHDYDLPGLYKRCRNEGMGLRELGCPYSMADMIMDMGNPRKNLVWLRDFVKGRLTSMAALTFPLVRPAAVYVGSRFGRTYLR